MSELSSVSSPESDSSTAVEQRQLRRVIAASLLGTTVEWYDFFLYSTAAAVVFNKLFFPDQSSFVGTMLSFATFAVGFVMRPIGGLVFGHIGDRIGRRKTLAITMLLMGIATTLMGALPTAEQVGVIAPILLLLLRIIQGFALGGEWAGAVLMAVEHAPAGKKGRFGSVPQIGLALGLGIGTVVFALLQTVFDDEQFLAYGWRIAFAVSIVLVVVGVIVRLAVDETPAFVATQKTLNTASTPIRKLLADPQLRKNTIAGCLARWAEGSSFNTWGVFVITYATATLAMDEVGVLLAVAAASGVMAVVIPFAGSLVDKYGTGLLYGIGVALYGVAVIPVFALFNTGSLVLLFVGLIIVFGVIHGVFYAAQGTFFAELFPTDVRYTGMSVVYQFSGIYASGLTPMILTALMEANGGLPWAAAGYLALTAVISVVATLWAVKLRKASRWSDRSLSEASSVHDSAVESADDRADAPVAEPARAH
ncbi:MAG TPA: MHS family MFS transporter [Candidatus Corynebacterium avicola]|uniref:Putative proline/betaine transporter n=1 Tax=Candidatus Corynebacterium avicola TaxID=2838527 RepID=A0A9D1RQH2_9CORY|nr:MHS family MFS transporter [Candidatus Corynebacterium avicola]